MNPIGNIDWQIGRDGGCASPVRTPLFIVVTLRVIDSIMKPKRKLNLFRMRRVTPKFFKLGKAFVEVSCSVVLPMRLRVAG